MYDFKKRCGRDKYREEVDACIVMGVGPEQN